MSEMDLSFLSSNLVGVVVLALVVILTVVVKYKRDRNLPPGPFSVPVLGSVGFFRQYKKKRMRHVMELINVYGKIFSVKAGNQLIVFLNDYDLVHEAFVEKGHLFCDRPNWLKSLQEGLAEGKGIAWGNGPLAVKMRKFALNSLRGFGLGKSSFAEKIRVETDTLAEILRARSGTGVELKQLLLKAVTNVIHSIVFSVRYDFEEKKFQELLETIDAFFRRGMLVPENFLPEFICKLMPKDAAQKTEKDKAVRAAMDYIYSFIREHEETFDPDDIRDFIDLYIKTAREEESNAEDCIPKGTVFRAILDLFLAGTETTSNLLHWCFVTIAKHQGVQQKCFQEVRQFSDSPVKSECPYVQAFLLEVSRISSVVPLGMPHTSSTPTSLAGYTIPANTMVFGNLYACSMDPNVWKDPEVLRPERHLTENGEFVKSKKLIPFSIGNRSCIGDKLAETNIFLIFTGLLTKFKFTIEDSKEDMEQRTPIREAGHSKVIITER